MASTMLVRLAPASSLGVQASQAGLVDGAAQQIAINLGEKVLVRGAVRAVGKQFFQQSKG